MEEKYTYDFEIVRGDSFDREIIFDGIDLTGMSAQAQIRPKAGSEDLTAEFACTMDYDRAAARITLTSAQSMAIAAGKYEYDVALVSMDGFVRHYLGGKFVIRECVTEVVIPQPEPEPEPEPDDWGDDSI